VMRAQADEDDSPVDHEPWHAYQRWLASGDRRVFVPFAKALVP
jgi:hypothetical protein